VVVAAVVGAEVGEVVVGDVMLRALASGGIEASSSSRYILYDTDELLESAAGVELGNVRSVTVLSLDPAATSALGSTTLNPLADCTVLSPIPPSRCPPGCVSSTPGIAESYFRRGSSRESGISLSGIGGREGKSMERRGTVFGFEVEDLEVSVDVLIEECAAA